jgi:hypothetical protein
MSYNIYSAVYCVCDNDKNGNPRRAWVIELPVDNDEYSTFEYVYIEGYDGSYVIPEEIRSYVTRHSIRVDITPKFYRELLKRSKSTIRREK